MIPCYYGKILFALNVAQGAGTAVSSFDGKNWNGRSGLMGFPVWICPTKDCQDRTV